MIFVIHIFCLILLYHGIGLHVKDSLYLSLSRPLPPPPFSCSPSFSLILCLSLPPSLFLFFSLYFPLFLSFSLSTSPSLFLSLSPSPPLSLFLSLPLTLNDLRGLQFVAGTWVYGVIYDICMHMLSQNFEI